MYTQKRITIKIITKHNNTSIFENKYENVEDCQKKKKTKQDCIIFPGKK